MAALYYGNISFGTGLVFGLKMLFVTAVGGYRDPPRAALGAPGFGIAESLWSGYFPLEWRDAWMFALLVAMLVLRAGAAADRQQLACPEHFDSHSVAICAVRLCTTQRLDAASDRAIS